ncbi:MAG: PAS domain S-box protein [Candidatus Omnitrophica bacterium]|nr:PAS domain S-box protein [Candidatus Omnitrophota bacterium]
MKAFPIHRPPGPGRRCPKTGNYPDAPKDETGCEGWLEALFTHTAQAILVHAMDGHFIDVNPAACAILGYSRDELLVLRPWDIVMDARRERMRRMWRGTERGRPVLIERTYRRKDGQRVEAEARLTRVAFDGGDAIVETCRDMTERKRIKEALRGSEQLARGQAEALRQALDALARETTSDKLLGHILCILRQQMNAHCVSLWLEAEAGPAPGFNLSCLGGRVDSRAAADPTLATSNSSWQEDPLREEILRTGRPVLCEAIGKDSRARQYRRQWLEQGIQVVLAVPLIAAGRVIGSIRICSCHPHAYRAEDIELAQALAHQVTLSLQLTRLVEQNRQAAVLEERNRLARDIHDTLAQNFNAIVLNLEAADAAVRNDRIEEANRHIRNAVDQARLGLGEARRSVRALRSQALEYGDLWAMFGALFKQANPGGGLRTSVRFQGAPRPLPPSWEEHLLRISQEALTNTLKHACASRFEAWLAFASRDLRLELRDNGTGFNPLSCNGGFGLSGMRERVKAMGGRLTLHSRAGKGTAIVVVLPYPSAS